MSRTRLLAAAAIALLAALSTFTPASGQTPEGLTVLRPLTGVRAVAGGYYHSCAVLASGQARCWGDNVAGQLGNGTIGGDGSLVAAPVRNAAGTGRLNGVTAIAAASGHSCALLANHQVRCWGDNGSGQLGNGTFQRSGLPVTVLNPAGTGPLGNVAQISADGDNSCARLVNGQVRCWGDNAYGDLGAGSPLASSPRPMIVVAVAGTAPLSGVTQIDTGWDSSCARTSAGRAVCWGNNQHGQLGDGNSSGQSNRPVVVENASGNAPLGGVKRVTAGDVHSCAVLEDGTGRCWGDNEFGQLGDGGTDPSPRPVAVIGESGTGRLRPISQIVTGFGHTCARLANGQVRCWGHNADAQVGQRDRQPRGRPARRGAQPAEQRSAGRHQPHPDHGRSHLRPPPEQRGPVLGLERLRQPRQLRRRELAAARRGPRGDAVSPADVVVVGARCAGAATALLLARQGYDVLLVDRAAFPSDTLSTHALVPRGRGPARPLGAARRRPRLRRPRHPPGAVHRRRRGRRPDHQADAPVSTSCSRPAASCWTRSWSTLRSRPAPAPHRAQRQRRDPATTDA